MLTFTNNAATEITERVCQFAGSDRIGFPHFVGTIDSWLHQYIAHPFGHHHTKYDGINGDASIRLIDDTDTPIVSSDKNFLHPFKLQTPLPLFANNIQKVGSKEWKIRMPGKRGETMLLSEYYASPKFQEYLDRVDKDREWLTIEKVSSGFLEVKKKFLKAGLANYADMELISGLLLFNNETFRKNFSKRFPVVLVDECQDLSGIQLSILELLIKEGTVVHSIGDLNQAIYEFKDVDPAAVENFTVKHKFVDPQLTKNFRSSEPIVEISNKLITGKIKPSAHQKSNITNACLCLSYPQNRISELPQWFERHIEHLNATEPTSIDLPQSKIIARGWSTVSKLRASGRQIGLTKHQWPIAAMLLWKLEQPESIPEAINLMGRFVSKVCLPEISSTARNNYCPDVVSVPSTWRVLLSELLNKCVQHPKFGDLDATWKDWAGYVRSEFSSILSEVLPCCPELTEKNIANLSVFRAPNGDGAKSVKSGISISTAEKSNIPITTIHDVKGQTFDATMVVSSTSRGGSDGHWSHWLVVPSSEAARLAYVASSRSKNLLVWAVPEATAADKKKLADVGFEIVDMD